MALAWEDMSEEQVARRVACSERSLPSAACEEEEEEQPQM